VRDPAALRDGAPLVVLDGRELDGEAIPLVDDGARHDVVIRPGRPGEGEGREAGAGGRSGRAANAEPA
jgi:hypothetical protein